MIAKAEQLGVPLGTVHTRLRLGMAKLRDLCSRWFVEEGAAGETRRG